MRDTIESNPGFLQNCNFLRFYPSRGTQCYLAVIAREWEKSIKMVVFREEFITRFLLFDETFDSGEKKLDRDFYESNKIWVPVVKKDKTRLIFGKTLFLTYFFNRYSLLPAIFPDSSQLSGASRTCWAY